MFARHVTLAPTTVDTVTLDQERQWVTVLNRDGAYEIYFTVDGSDPSVGGDDTYVVAKAIGAESTARFPTEVEQPPGGENEPVVKLISSGAAELSVVSE